MLTDGMDKEKDSFNVVSHSMGGSFSEGIMKLLKEKGWNVDILVHFNAWEPTEMKGFEDIFTIDATTTFDPVQFLSLPINLDNNIPGSDLKIRVEEKESLRYIHRELIDGKEIWRYIQELMRSGNYGH